MTPRATPASVRRTLTRAVRFQGPALFTGLDATLTIHPLNSSTTTTTGLILRVRDSDTPLTIDRLSGDPIHPVFASLKPRCTSVRTGRTDIPAVGTVEHVLAALAGLGITDAILETESPEVPILDGSAAPFARAILDAGITHLDGPFRPVTLAEPVEIRDGDALLTAEPADSIDYAYRLDYGSDSDIPPATARWLGDHRDFAACIAPARTFSTVAEADRMKSLGLFARFTPADLPVIGPDGPIDNAWRFPDECARHKLLDLIGDLALLGRPLIARVRAHKTGHAHTHALVRAIAQAIA
jgi:UDP-3-O-acyl N-acetylglucosamine deacetylase